MLDEVGYIHSVESFGSVDGPGIRYLLFLQGCHLRCRYCHNPDTWKLRGGRKTTAGEAVKDILKYRQFISGVTLSGGEPLLQHEFCRIIIDEAGKKGLHTAIDTSGSVPLEVSKDAVYAADLIMLDIKALSDELSHSLTGYGNGSALELLDYCERVRKPVWIRHVLVPGITLEHGMLTELADFLKEYKCIEKVELLPFHKLGEYKWAQLGLEYTLGDTPIPTAGKLDSARKIFSERDFVLS